MSHMKQVEMSNRVYNFYEEQEKWQPTSNLMELTESL